MDISQVHQDVVARARRIKLLTLDVDGVLTDGKLYFSNQGDEIKTFNSLDGHGIKLLQQSGVTVAIITGRTSTIVQRRAQELGITYLIQGREDKLAALEEIRQQLPLDYEAIGHIGDDYPDLPLIRRVGLGISVADGHWVVTQHAHWCSRFAGGSGAVREACDLIMLAQGTFESALAAYL